MSSSDRSSPLMLQNFYVHFDMSYCPKHNVEFKLIPAGVSRKTNRPYVAFFTCPERDCNEKPPKGTPVVETPKLNQTQNKILEDLVHQVSNLNFILQDVRELLKKHRDAMKNEIINKIPL